MPKWHSIQDFKTYAKVLRVIFTFKRNKIMRKLPTNFGPNGMFLSNIYFLFIDLKIKNTYSNLNRMTHKIS